LVGFVSPTQGGGGYWLTRLVIFCCAADAEVLQAVVRGDPTPGGSRSRAPGCPAHPRPMTTPVHRRRRCTPTWCVRRKLDIELVPTIIAGGLLHARLIGASAAEARGPAWPA
jgi:hypothetical protein